MKMIVLTNLVILLAQIEEVGADIGEPDCKLIEPFVFNQQDGTILPWLSEFTVENTFMISSDKILTIVEPNEKYIKLYEEATK